MVLARRLELQTLLESFLGSDQVYFQPPENTELGCPAITYSHDDTKSEFADNFPYLLRTRYQVTIIVRDPDSDIPDKIAALPLCSFDRAFVVENLYHKVYVLYF